MARYRYAAEFNPPAPFVQVTLRNPTTGEQRQDIPAQVDTAALIHLAFAPGEPVITPNGLRAATLVRL